jgi:hypothetical protein
MKLVGIALLVMGLAALVFTVPAAAEKVAKEGDTRVFEFRVYHAAPGKMDALHARFRNHTIKLFKKHGIEVIGFWVAADPVAAQQKLYYIVAFPSQEAAQKSWKAFREDPEWIAAKAASEKEGTLVQQGGIESTYLKPTDYSPIK